MGVMVLPSGSATTKVVSFALVVSAVSDWACGVAVAAAAVAAGANAIAAIERRRIREFPAGMARGAARAAGCSTERRESSGEAEKGGCGCALERSDD